MREVVVLLLVDASFRDRSREPRMGMMTRVRVYLWMLEISSPVLVAF